MSHLNTLIKYIKINRFRNLSYLEIPYCAKVNVFYGNNGSGKTSILESLYYLSMFKSFRTSSYQRLLQYGQEDFSIFVKLMRGDKLIPMGIERDISGGKKIRLDGEKINAVAVLAKQLPIIMIDPHSYRFFHDGPKVRRSFIDFGLFHVEQKFYGVWKQFHYVLKQRNACLKQKLGKNEVAIWSKEFCELANTLDKYRKEYLDKFRVKYLELLTRILPNYDDIHLRYHSGWNSEYDLQDLLEQNYFSDNRIGFTQLGPHRADLQLYYSENIPAQDAFSQGQQKLASYALYLTQGSLLQELQNISPIYLIDDLPSELDMDKNRQLVSILKEMQAQIFVTGVQKQDLEYWSSADEVQMFHVKQGEIERQTTLS